MKLDKELPRASGIYYIRCSGNNKGYIGSTNDFKKRFWKHSFNLRKNIHHSKYLQNTYDKYGDNSLTFSIIAICPSEYKFKLEHWFIHNSDLNSDLNMRKNIEGCIYNNVGENNRMSKLKEYQIPEIIKDLNEENLSYKEIGDKYGVNEAAIRAVKNGKTWKSFNYLVNPEIRAKRFVNITCKKAVEILNTLIETGSKSKTAKRCRVTDETLNTIINSNIYSYFEELRQKAKMALYADKKYESSFMTDDLYIDILERLNLGQTVFEICKCLGLSRSRVNCVKFGKGYKYYFNKYKHLRNGL